MEQIKTLLELQNGKLEAQPSPKILAQRQENIYEGDGQK